MPGSTMSSAALVEPSGWGRALIRAAACLAATAGLCYVAVWTPLGQRLDSGLMGVGFGPLPRPIELLQLLRKGSVVVLAALVVVAALSALQRRRWLLVVRCVVLVGVSFGAAGLLRRALARPNLGDATYPFNTWPSGHVATTTALIVSAFLLAPPSWHTRRVRRIATVTLVIVAGASIATLAHRPSDVIAAMLGVAGLAALLFPTGPLGWRALRPDGPAAGISLAVALLATVTPWLDPLGAIANAAWLTMAGLVTTGWREAGAGAQTVSGSTGEPSTPPSPRLPERNGADSEGPDRLGTLERWVIGGDRHGSLGLGLVEGVSDPVVVAESSDQSD